MRSSSSKWFFRVMHLLLLPLLTTGCLSYRLDSADQLNQQLTYLPGSPARGESPCSRKGYDEHDNLKFSPDYLEIKPGMKLVFHRLLRQGARNTLEPLLVESSWIVPPPKNADGWIDRPCESNDQLRSSAERSGGSYEQSCHWADRFYGPADWLTQALWLSSATRPGDREGQLSSDSALAAMGREGGAVELFNKALETLCLDVNWPDKTLTNHETLQQALRGSASGVYNPPTLRFDVPAWLCSEEKPCEPDDQGRIVFGVQGHAGNSYFLSKELDYKDPHEQNDHYNPSASIRGVGFIGLRLPVRFEDDFGSRFVPIDWTVRDLERRYGVTIEGIRRPKEYLCAQSSWWEAGDGASEASSSPWKPKCDALVADDRYFSIWFDFNRGSGTARRSLLLDASVKKTLLLAPGDVIVRAHRTAGTDQPEVQ